jgi:transketolase
MSQYQNKIEMCHIAAKKMRRDSLSMSLAAGATGAHLGGGLSMIEIMAVLYLGVMRYDTKSTLWEGRDRFILSKGHGALAYYTALNQAGFIEDEELATFKANDTFLYGHPSMNLSHGIEFSSGSLGHGLSLGVGSALALRRKSNTDSRVFVVIGDGECNEGMVWEAAASAAHFNLSNLVAIVDKNGLQYDGDTRRILSMDSLSDKWASFGWKVVSLDGHNVEQLLDALTQRPAMPLVVIANTIKGKGVSFMENNPSWHHSRLTKVQFDQAMAEQGGAL